MKSEKSPNQDQRVRANIGKIAHPVRPEDFGDQSFGCSGCGRIFVEKGTAAWIRSFGDFYCSDCRIWSRPTAETPPTAP